VLLFEAYLEANQSMTLGCRVFLEKKILLTDGQLINHCKGVKVITIVFVRFSGKLDS
jgi:hypothetical protein